MQQTQFSKVYIIQRYILQFLHIFIIMDDHSNINRVNGTSNHTKSYASTVNMANNGTYQPPPRMSYNSAYTHSNKDLGMSKQQPYKRAQNYHSSSNQTATTYSVSTSGSTRPQLPATGPISSNKGTHSSNNGNSLGNSPITPKHVPSFIESRNQMKGSLFMNQDSSSKNIKTQGSHYNGHYVEQNNIQKRAPRMSEQPEMKSSGIEFGSQNFQKVPSFLHQKPAQKQKKIPYQNELQRPESSKQAVYKNTIPNQSLSSSYGSTKKSKIEDFEPIEQLDPSADWVKRSWNKRKEKKISITDFEKIKDLGSGKYGQVYLAKEKKSNFVFAIKIIEKKLIKQQEITQQFIRELKIQSFLNHPNIIRMYGFFDDNAYIYIILEVGTGGQLFKQLKKHQSMPEPKVAGLMRQVCQAVSQLHSYHIIHRDIKPENIVLSEGVVKLCDFGWSVYSGETLRSTFCGTPLYVGPEILKGKEYDQKIDIWSLGVMMYEMLIGENPFKITKQQQLIKIVKDEIKIPSYAEISDEAKDFLFSCLQKNPENRLSIRELLNHSFFKKYPEKSDKKVSI